MPFQGRGSRCAKAAPSRFAEDARRRGAHAGRQPRRRGAADAGGNLRPHPAGAHLPQHRRSHRLRECAAPPARALLLRRRGGRLRPAARAHHLRQRGHEQHLDARGAGRPALRRRRAQRHEGLPWRGGLSRDEPCQGRFRAGPLELSRPAACAVWQVRRHRGRAHAGQNQGIAPMAAVPSGPVRMVWSNGQIGTKRTPVKRGQLLIR